MITGQLAEAVITDKAAGVAARLCGPALALVTSAASLAHHGYLGQVANMCRYGIMDMKLTYMLCVDMIC